jgi:hypothetical protein
MVGRKYVEKAMIHQILSAAFMVGVIGNLVASAVLGVPAFIHLHRKLDRHHAELTKGVTDAVRHSQGG